MPDEKTRRTHLAEIIDIAGAQLRYDAAAKELLADKAVVSEILHGLLPEFHDIPVREIGNYIPKPFVGTVKYNPGETNASIVQAEVIRSLGQEQKVSGEGECTFDVFFPLTLPRHNGKDETANVYVNLEAQSSEALPYTLEERAVFYAARLLSSQYQRDFTHSNYQLLKKAYSIWVVISPEVRKENTISSICLRQDSVAGTVEDDRSYDLIQIFIVRLGPDYTDTRVNRLVRLLTALFSGSLGASEKKQVLGEDFGLQMSEELGKEIDEMCNLSQGLIERSMAQGMAQGKAAERFETIERLLRNGRSVEAIVDFLGFPIDEVLDVQSKITTLKQ